MCYCIPVRCMYLCVLSVFVWPISVFLLYPFHNRLSLAWDGTRKRFIPHTYTHLTNIYTLHLLMYTHFTYVYKFTLVSVYCTTKLLFFGISKTNLVSFLPHPQKRRSTEIQLDLQCLVGKGRGPLIPRFSMPLALPFCSRTTGDNYKSNIWRTGSVNKSVWSFYFFYLLIYKAAKCTSQLGRWTTRCNWRT